MEGEIGRRSRKIGARLSILVDGIDYVDLKTSLKVSMFPQEFPLQLKGYMSAVTAYSYISS